MSNGFGIRSMRAGRELGRPGAEVRGDLPADRDDRVRAGERVPLARQVAPHVRDRAERERPRDAGSRPEAPRHPADRALRAQHRLRLVVDERRPVADRPVVADGGHDRSSRCLAGEDGGGHGQRMLPVDHVDAIALDDAGEMRCEPRVEPLVLDVVAHERDAGRGERELVDGEAVVFARSVGCPARPRLHHPHVVAAPAQPARELPRAPAAAAAGRRERIGREQDAHATAAPPAAEERGWRRPARRSGRAS